LATLKMDTYNKSLWYSHVIIGALYFTAGGSRGRSSSPPTRSQPWKSHLHLLANKGLFQMWCDVRVYKLQNYLKKNQMPENMAYQMHKSLRMILHFLKIKNGKKECFKWTAYFFNTWLGEPSIFSTSIFFKANT